MASTSISVVLGEILVPRYYMSLATTPFFNTPVGPYMRWSVHLIGSKVPQCDRDLEPCRFIFPVILRILRCRIEKVG
jgi:hypothetical protein